MAGNRKRVDWTEFEMAQVYAAALEVIKARKIPLPISTPKARAEFLKIMRVEAQLPLPQNRKRHHIAGLDNITDALRKRFIDNEVLPRNWHALKKGARPDVAEALPDPKDQRITALEQELAQEQQKNKDLLEQNEGLIRANLALRNQPTPVEMMQRFIADTIALAMDKVEDKKLRERGVLRVPPKEQPPPPFDKRGTLPDFEKKRRDNPEYLLAQGNGVKKPKIMVLGGMNKDYALIQEALKEHADMRYVDDPKKAGALGPFNANGGRIVLWVDFASHEFDDKLQAQGVSFRRVKGSLGQLIEELKLMAEGKK